jgi:hypothetical protein
MCMTYQEVKARDNAIVESIVLKNEELLNCMKCNWSEWCDKNMAKYCKAEKLQDLR